MTLSIDGWTDVSGFSIYALLLLRGQYIKQFVDILDLNLKRHTAENLVEAVKNCLDWKCISLKNISAVVTDSPSVMIKFQDKPYIMKTHCVLHAFNLIAKHFIMHPTMAPIVKGNNVLVNYFSNSSFWGEFLIQWASNNNISHGLSTLLISVIENQDHFTSNDTLVSLLKPVVDSIGHLENSNTKLSDILQELLAVYKSLLLVNVYSHFASFKQHCIKVLHQRSEFFQSNIYIISFFLHPLFQNVAVSLNHSLKDITLMILVLANHWQYYKEDSELLIPQIKCYYSQPEPFGNACNAMDYWLGLPDNPQCSPLKKFAITISEIVPHAAGIEGLFSLMSAIKTKYQNPMLPTTLKMISQIKLHLTQKKPQKSKNKHKNDEHSETSEYDCMCGYDFFSSPLELENFEDGVFDQADMQLTSRQDAFIETMFDFDSWEQANPIVATPQIVVGGDLQELHRTAIWDPYNMDI
ncbi:hypothetical protein O181_001105 [Austropuccinia psidii MF-1]|uniref:DUF659 domain-containing protein n=1 Tax=Austropuccinia psidii MF-1 TaxID=1389203 RepID=A0A9Q3BA18_9BASI|nr:hypothetical protein [Austropuccinia psidii MF-1]